MKKTTILITTVVAAAMLLLAMAPTNAGMFSSPEEKRDKIDVNTRYGLERLLTEDTKAKRLFESAHGYAVFAATKIAIGLTGGGGSGVAVEKETGKRVYMKMGTGGIGLGLGGQAYKLIFLFEDEGTYFDFVYKGWEASASANAVALRAGANAEATFTNGMAVYQLTDAGLMISADIAGTRYWRNTKLNKGVDEAPKRTAEIR